MSQTEATEFRPGGFFRNRSIADGWIEDGERSRLGTRFWILQEEILHGRETEPGATMLQVFSTTMVKVHDPVFLPIEVDIDIGERTAKVRIPGRVQADVEPIRNPVTGDPHTARINLPFGFEYTTAEVANATFKTEGPIEHDYTNVHAQLTMLNLTQSGPVR